MVILNESMVQLGTQARWTPTERQLADCLTKNKIETTDLIRAVMTNVRYQLSSEPTVMHDLAQARAARKQAGLALRRNPTSVPTSPLVDKTPVGDLSHGQSPDDSDNRWCSRALGGNLKRPAHRGAWNSES